MSGTAEDGALAMSGTVKNFALKIGAALVVTGASSFAGAILGLYMFTARTEKDLASLQKEFERHDLRIERLEYKSEAQGRELAKLADIPGDLKEVRGDVKTLLQRKN